MSPDNRTIYRYLAYGIGFANTDKSTFFKNIYQLEPARFIVVKNGALAFKTYWDFDFSRKNELSQAETFERFAGLFEDSVKLRLRSDVPVGFYLSGGLDSSSVTSVAHSLLADQQITAFSTRYEEPGFDEHKYAAEVADFNNIDIVYVSPKPEELFENISKIVWHLDEPFQHLNIYAQWCIMREADKRGIKVMLTGHGGDEMLHSYPRQHMYYFSDLFLRLKWRRLMKEISFYSRIAGHSRTKLLSNAVRLALTLSLPLKIPYIGYRFLPQALDCLDKDFRRRYAHDFYFPDRGIKGVMNKSYQLEYRLSPVPIWLRCEDRVSMAFSVESRSPFFDHRLVEFCVALESGYKIKNGVSKYILRQSLSNKLPHKVLARSDKKGFTAPSEIWMKNELKGRITEIFSSPEFKRRGYLDQSAVLKEFNLHCKGQKNLRAAIWSWVNLELWFKEFFKK
jgi:asparagine synthase (glutamine-hydrolysing)